MPTERVPGGKRHSTGSSMIWVLQWKTSCPVSLPSVPLKDAENAKGPPQLVLLALLGTAGVEYIRHVGLYQVRLPECLWDIPVMSVPRCDLATARPIHFLCHFGMVTHHGVPAHPVAPVQPRQCSQDQCKA